MIDKEKMEFGEAVERSLYERAKQFSSKILLRFARAYTHTISFGFRPKLTGIPEFYFYDVLTKHINGSGSQFNCVNVKSLIHLLFADYGNSWEEFIPKNPIPGCTYFRNRIPNVGKLGAVPISTLGPKTDLHIERAVTGSLEVTCKGEAVDTDTVTLILGPADGDFSSEEVFFSLHPGEPLEPGKPSDDAIEGAFVNPQTAIAMGFRTAKFVREA